jgi:hypothetical protein
VDKTVCAKPLLFFYATIEEANMRTLQLGDDDHHETQPSWRLSKTALRRARPSSWDHPHFPKICLSHELLSHGLNIAIQ